MFMLNISHPLSGGCDACLSIRRQGLWSCQRRGVLPKLSLCLDLCKIIERQECILWPLPWLESRLLETLWCIRLSAGEVVNFEKEAKLSPRHDMQQQPQPHVTIMAMVTWWCDDMVVMAEIKMMHQMRFRGRLYLPQSLLFLIAVLPTMCTCAS